MGTTTTTMTMVTSITTIDRARGATLSSMALARMLPWMALSAAMAAASGCGNQASACHREAIERFGCCPVCDGDCRAKISSVCAEEHDVPFDDIEAEPPEANGDQSESSGGDDDGLDEPR